MLEEIGWLVVMAIPSGIGVLAAWVLHRLPPRWHSFAEAILVCSVIGGAWLIWHDAEDGWGPLLMCWPLSGVLVFVGSRFYIRRKHPFDYSA